MHGFISLPDATSYDKYLYIIFIYIFFQEPGTDAEIKQFISTKYCDKMEMFSKINVNGDGALPLYKFLKAKQKGTFGE